MRHETVKADGAARAASLMRHFAQDAIPTNNLVFKSKFHNVLEIKTLCFMVRILQGKRAWHVQVGHQGNWAVHNSSARVRTHIA